MKRMIPLLLIGVFLLSACSATGDIEVHNAWARPTVKGETAAVYLTLHNHTKTDDKLISASSNVADVVEMHQSKMENDVMQMGMLTSLQIDAGEEVIFTPGGLHFMLVNIKQDLILGEHIGLILHFKNHADIVVNVQIADSVPDEQHDH